jgi:hypothetical protein
MAYCPHCAAVLDPNLAMCAQCGQLVNAAPPPAPAVLDARPESVRLAIILLLISWAMPLLLLARAATIYGFRFGIMAQSLAVAVVGIALIAFLWQRQNWARIAVLVLILWVVGNLAMNMLRLVGAHITWGWAPSIATGILRICAAYLLFRPESNAWFKK